MEGENAGGSKSTPQRAFGRRRLQGSSQAYSFLLFSALAFIAIAFFPRFYAYFVGAVAVDGIATIIGSDVIVRADRSVLSLALVILTVAEGSYNLFFLFLEVVILITVLDTSFLLRRLEGTTVDLSVLGARLRSHAYSLVPALLLSWSLTYLYSLGLGPSTEPVVLLAASCPAALFVIYVVARYLSSPPEDQGQGPKTQA
ncbi:MAG: hypothetical protein OK456_04925 [Thaumarchaeota archaeon]|nr:hypothetical protein [Nitrososphaerota archaeon]